MEEGNEGEMGNIAILLLIKINFKKGSLKLLSFGVSVRGGIKGGEGRRRRQASFFILNVLFIIPLWENNECFQSGEGEEGRILK